MGTKERDRTKILTRNFHISEQAQLIFFIPYALCGFLLFSLLLSSSLMGFCMAAMTVTASNLSLTYSILFLTSNGWISGTVNWTPPLSRNHRLHLGGEDYPPDLKCPQLVATDWMAMIAQVMLSNVNTEAWPACSMQTSISLCLPWILFCITLDTEEVVFLVLMRYLMLHGVLNMLNEPMSMTNYLLQRGDLVIFTFNQCFKNLFKFTTCTLRDHLDMSADRSPCNSSGTKHIGTKHICI